MKLNLLLLGFAVLTSFQCTKNKASETSEAPCLKGKLVKKGICMNYTISVVDGDIDPALIEASWTDPQTNIAYTNAFALGSQCTFPVGIAEGSEFYFKITPQKDADCVVCYAYYPTPNKRLVIEVLDASCDDGKVVQ